MKAVIERLERDISKTEDLIKESERLSDTQGIQLLRKRLNKLQLMLALNRAYQEKKLDEVIITVIAA